MEKIKYVHFSNVMRCLLSEDENAFIGSVIQKLNWNIDDFNGSFENIELRKDIVYLIVLGDWIVESCDCIYESYKKYAKDFVYSNKNLHQVYHN